MLRGFISSIARAHGGGTVYKTMIMPVISKITTVNPNFGEGSNAIFIQDTEVTTFGGNEFFFVRMLKGRSARRVFEGVRGGWPFDCAVREK